MEIKSINNHWNLYEIIQTENGITKLPSNYKENGKYKFLDYKNVYKKENICNFVYKNLPKINIFEKDIYFKYKSQKNSIAITWSSETNIDIFQASFISTDKPLVLNGFCKIIKIKKEIPILPKWLTWYLNFNKNIQKIRRSISYTTRCNMTINELKNIYIPKIDLYTQQAIINIIKPFENLKSKILKNKNKLINFIDNVYKYISSNSQKEITLLSFANLFNKKYLNQNLYVETSNINENMSITNTLKNITKNKKPSRANLSVAQNSLIFSKLIGSKKIFPIYDCNYTLYVYSTGFYNISANELNWYLLGFLNSKDFEIQKNNNSSGTLMEGITIEGLKKVKLKIPNENYELNIILKLISKLNLMLKNIDEIINKLIQLYVV